MRSRLLMPLIGGLLILAACTSGEDASPGPAADAPPADAEPTTAEPSAAEPSAMEPAGGAAETETAMPDRDEVVWADQDFLEQEGVKAGKDAIYLPTPPMVIDKMIELAEIAPDDLVYDLGTGDGRIAIAVAQQVGARTIGYEIDPVLAEKARANVRAAGVEDLVTIEERDVLTLDFSAVDVVLMYLDPDLNLQLLPRLRGLKDGARVVSHDWGMNDEIIADALIEGFKSREPDFLNLHNIYLWRAPFRDSE